LPLNFSLRVAEAYKACPSWEGWDSRSISTLSQHVHGPTISITKCWLISNQQAKSLLSMYYNRISSELYTSCLDRSSGYPNSQTWQGPLRRSLLHCPSASLDHGAHGRLSPCLRSGE
jgi:hypothetical protein